MKNVKIYYPTLDLKTCWDILFVILSSYLRSDCRDLIYFRYIDKKSIKLIYEIFVPLIASVPCQL